MSETSPICPQCESTNSYEDGNVWICAECFHEWTVKVGNKDDSSNVASGFKDANGVPLENGDTVATIKDLKAGKDTLKSGTKVKNIRLLDEPFDGHDIACKIPGHGSMYLKCSVVKKIKK